jgi:hypothetical protein
LGRDRFPEEVSGEVCLIRHGIAHVGPIGELITTATFSVTRAEGTSELITNAPFHVTHAPGTRDSLTGELITTAPARDKSTRYTGDEYHTTAPFHVTHAPGTHVGLTWELIITAPVTFSEGTC